MRFRQNPARFSQRLINYYTTLTHFLAVWNTRPWPPDFAVVNPHVLVHVRLEAAVKSVYRPHLHVARAPPPDFRRNDSAASAPVQQGIVVFHVHHVQLDAVPVKVFSHDVKARDGLGHFVSGIGKHDVIQRETVLNQKRHQSCRIYPAAVSHDIGRIPVTLQVSAVLYPACGHTWPLSWRGSGPACEMACTRTRRPYKSTWSTCHGMHPATCRFCSSIHLEQFFTLPVMGLHTSTVTDNHGVFLMFFQSAAATIMLGKCHAIFA